MAVYRLGNDAPIIPASAHVAKEATVVGKVKLGEFASVWPGAVIRGDDEPIHVGERACRVAQCCTPIPAVLSSSVTTLLWGIKQCFTVARSAPVRLLEYTQSFAAEQSSGRTA